MLDDDPSSYRDERGTACVSAGGEHCGKAFSCRHPLTKVASLAALPPKKLEEAVRSK